MINCISDSVTVYRKDGVSSKGKPYSLYSLGLSKKEGNGWLKGYVPCSFKKGITINNKAKLKLEEAFLSFDEYNGEKKVKVVITKYKIVDLGDIPEQKSEFMPITDDLPFR